MKSETHRKRLRELYADGIIDAAEFAQRWRLFEKNELIKHLGVDADRRNHDKQKSEMRYAKAKD